MTLKEFNATSGHCPVCGAESYFRLAGAEEFLLPELHIVWDDISAGIISYVYIEYICPKCGQTFRQLYNLQYAGQELDK